MKQSLYITGMHCKKCKVKIIESLLTLPDIQSVRIDVESGRAVLTVSSYIEKTVLREKIGAAGNYIYSDNSPSLFGILIKKIRKYRPILIVLTGITLFTLIRQTFLPIWNLHDAIHDFMAGFFLIFGGFKIINWKKFTQGFRSYDPCAMRSKWYAYIYPVIEIVLGLAYAFRFQPEFLMNFVTIIVLSVTSIGIFRILHRGDEVQCACLGGFFNIPISWFTIFENALMISMAIYMQIV